MSAAEIMMQNDTLARPFELPNGQVVRNRTAKSAMSEGLATASGEISDELLTLYERWGRGGIGLCITGNVMIDRHALGEPGNVVVETGADEERLRMWASAGKATGATLYMQLNHPGRQVPRFLNDRAVAPSAVPMKPQMRSYFPPPEALTGDEINEIIARFATAASIAERAGFDGVQVHGAHGYLVSQFLSPLTNQRDDDWGGTPQKRQRFALEVCRAIRAATTDRFGLGIKINSADFQRGGFSTDESRDAIIALADEGLEFVEVSGGTYESPAMVSAKPSTIAREAYFLEFAEQIRADIDTPIILTGGFRSSRAMAAAINSGAIDFVGMARPLAINPEFPLQLVADLDAHMDLKPVRTGLGAVDRMSMMETLFYERQLHRIGKGRDPRPDESPLISMVAHGLSHGLAGFRTRRGS